MVKKVLSLMLVGAMACSMLAGCGSTNQEELPKEGTSVEQSTENNNAGTNLEPSEDGMDGVVTELPEGTYVRVVPGGYIKESQNGDGMSDYQVVFGGADVTGSNTDMRLAFKSIQNIGAWSDENTDPGVWRYIDNNTWFTAVVWSTGLIPSTDEFGQLFIDQTGIEDIKSMLQGMTVYEDTVETRSTDKYAAVTVKVDRVDAGLSGYITILDDKQSSFRWIVQFLMLSESADLDMLKETAMSACVGEGFDREKLEAEAEISKTPLTMEDIMNKNAEENAGVNQPAEPGEGPVESGEEPVESGEEPVESVEETTEVAETEGSN